MLHLIKSGRRLPTDRMAGAWSKGHPTCNRLNVSPLEWVMRSLVAADMTAARREQTGRIAVDLDTLVRTVDVVVWEDRNLRRT